MNTENTSPRINPAYLESVQAELDMRIDWIEHMNRILGYDNSDGFHSSPGPFEIAQNLVAERATLREENRELREALRAIAPQVGSMLGRLKFSTEQDALILPSIKAILAKTAH